MKALLRSFAVLACGLTVAAHAQEIATLSTRPGVTQTYFLARAPEKPRAITILFPGGGGFIRLRSENGQIKFDNENFLARSRSQFVNRGVVVAVVDAPRRTSRAAGA